MPDLYDLRFAGRRLVILVLGMLIASPVLAQDTGTIAGRVVDARTQEPLADINVVVAGTLLGATTGPQGAFRIENVPPDAYTVQVSALGYRAARWSVEVAAGEAVELTFRLTPAGQGGEAADIDPEALAPRVEYTARALRELGASDAGLALRRMAGAGAARRGALGFGPNVRGLMGPQVGVFVDGTRVFAADPLRTAPPLSVVDPSMVERIEVVQGPYALAQGGGALSALRVETTGFEDEDAGGWLQGGFRGNGQGAETAGTLGGGFLGAPFRVHAAYRTGRDYEAGDGQSVPNRYTSGAVQGRVDVPLTASARLSTWGRFQDQRGVRYPGRPLDVAALTRGQGAVRYTLDREAGPVRRLEVQAHAAQALQTMDNEQKPPRPGEGETRGYDVTLDAELRHTGGRLAAELAPLRGVGLLVGSDVYRTRHDATRTLRQRATGAVPPFFTSEEVWPDVSMTDVGFFVRGVRAFGPVEAVATGRFDLVRADADRTSAAFLERAGDLTTDDLSASESHWSGALVLSTALTPRWTLALGGGSVARPADALERYSDRFPSPRTPTSAEAQGDPTLAPERSTQGDLWLQGAFERGQVRFGGFARRIDDYITLVPTDLNSLLPSSPGTVLRYINGTATVYGVDAAGRFEVNPLLMLRGQAGYLWGRDETADEPALGILPFTADLGLRVQAPFSEDLFLEAVAHLAADNDRVARTRGEVPTDGYATLDLRLGFSPAARTSLILHLANVTDTDYVYPLNARRPFDGAYVPEPGRSFGVNLRVHF